MVEPSILQVHAAAALQIDEALRRAATTEVLTISAVDVGGWAVIPAPGLSRLVENLWLARRTFSTIHFLMLHTAVSKTPAGDFTEDAGVLMRRLLELFAQTSWLTDHEPPADLELPGLVGDLTAIGEVDGEVPWPDEESRVATLGYLAGAVEWIDIQALRADRAELSQQRKTATALTTAPVDAATAQRYARGLALLDARDQLTVGRLGQLGAPVTPRHVTTDLLARLGTNYVVAYRYESDASHGMAMGRIHQRGKDGDPMLGAPSPDWRREMVMATSNAVMLELGSRTLASLGADTAELGKAAAEHRSLMDQSQPGDR